MNDSVSLISSRSSCINRATTCKKIFRSVARCCNIHRIFCTVTWKCNDYRTTMKCFLREAATSIADLEIPIYFSLYFSILAQHSKWKRNILSASIEPLNVEKLRPTKRTKNSAVSGRELQQLSKTLISKRRFMVERRLSKVGRHEESYFKKKN